MTHPQPSPIVDEVAEALRKAAKALQPFSDKVYNDNGDMTIDTSLPKTDWYANAYFALKAVNAALATPPKAGEGEPVAWRWKAHGHEAGPWIVVHDKGTAEAAMSLFASKGKHQSVQPLYATQQPRVDGVRVTDEMVEAAARAWCLEWDIDPDLPHALKPGQPAWWTFEARGIRAALTAALSLKQGETAP